MSVPPISILAVTIFNAFYWLVRFSSL